MARRTYNQACPLAYSLDLIGERWTLLIIRDLLLGPLRYSDMLKRLPGIGRNLLSSRLQELTERGLMVHRQLGPPSGSAVYELTELGKGLEPALLAFSQWGMRVTGDPSQLAGHGEPDLVAFVFKMAARRDRLPDRPLVFQCEADVTSFHVVAEPSAVSVFRGPTSRPDVVFKGDLANIVPLAMGGVAVLRNAIEQGAVTVSGEAQRVENVYQLYEI